MPAASFRDADVLAGRFERGDLVRVRAASSASATSCRSRCARSPRGAATRPTRRRSCRSPTATSTSSTASSSTSRGEVHDPAFSALLDGAAGRRGAARRAAPRAVHARRRTTPTSAGCSSTRSPSATLALETCPLHPRLDSGPAAHRGDRPRPRQDARVHLRRRDRPHRRGPPARPRRARAADARRARRPRPALDDARRLALAHCVLMPPRRRRRAAAASARPACTRKDSNMMSYEVKQDRTWWLLLDQSALCRRTGAKLSPFCRPSTSSRERSQEREFWGQRLAGQLRSHVPRRDLRAKTHTEMPAKCGHISPGSDKSANRLLIGAGSYADRHAKLLIHLAVEGSRLDAY